jgi:hypothetical protein
MSDTCGMEAVPVENSDTGRQELYIVYDGMRIAKRGYPGSPQAGTWVSLEPGYRVLDSGKRELVVEYDPPGLAS